MPVGLHRLDGAEHDITVIEEANLLLNLGKDELGCVDEELATFGRLVQRVDRDLLGAPEVPLLAVNVHGGAREGGGAAVREQEAADVVEVAVVDENVGDGPAVDALCVEVVEEEAGDLGAEIGVAGVEQHLAAAEVEVEHIVLEDDRRMRLEVELERALHDVRGLFVDIGHFEREPAVGYDLGRAPAKRKVVHRRVRTLALAATDPPATRADS